MKGTAIRNTTMGDAAVDGLLGGMTAGVVMAIYLVVFSFIGGEGSAVLGRFDPNNQSVLVGTLLHLAVSGVYGAVFGIGWKYMRRLNLPAWLVGLAFGVALFLLAEFVLLTTSQLPLANISFVQFGIGHAIYGLVTGWVISRNSKS